jgi:hypothetical protein
MNDMAASNTHDCFREFVGQKVIGLLFSALPWNRRDLAAGTKTLIFEDGRGLTIASNGSYWIESVEDVDTAVKYRQKELLATQRELAEVIELAAVRT